MPRVTRQPVKQDTLVIVALLPVLHRFGRLGVGGCPDILPPSIVGSLRGCTATQVACGTAHTLVLTADGKVYAWGYNGQGALGTGDEQDRLVPTLVSAVQ